jgi:uncharacterized membrane protein YebE (DUF533 family)
MGIISIILGNKYVVGLLLLLGLVGYGWYSGYENSQERVAKAEAAQQLAERKLEEKIVQADATHVQAEEKQQVIVKTVIQKVTNDVIHEVEKPIYLNKCFDDDGLLSANQALTANRPTPGGAPGKVPGPDTTK